MISSDNAGEKDSSKTSPKSCEGYQDKKATTEENSPADQDSGSSEEGEVEENEDTLRKEDGTYSSDSRLKERLTAPLPSEPPPSTQIDDGWAPVWEETAQVFYFFNRFTGASQWTNPRVPEAPVPIPNLGPPGVTSPSPAVILEPPPPSTTSGYNPAIHGDYDPNAWYAQPLQTETTLNSTSQNTDAASQYTATAAFNRFTGRFQNSQITPENFNDENKSKRQMNAYFDVDAAANSHDGRSLKAERSGKKLSKVELKQFKEKRKMKKEERRRAWLRD